MNMPQQPYVGEINSGDQSFGARLPYLVDGDYNLDVSRVMIRGRKEMYYVIEVEILESNVPERPAGAKCVAMIDLMNVDTRGKHICAFIASVFGYNPLQLVKDSTTTPWDGQSWTQYMNWTASEQNPLAKRRIRCNVTQVTTGAGGQFSLHTWSPFDPNNKLPPRVVTTPQYAPQGAQAPGGAAFQPPGAPAGGGFQSPLPQPGAAPQGFQQPQGGFQPQGGPLGGFQPPGAPAAAPVGGMPGGAPQGQPPAGWGPQGGAPVQPGGFQGPQGGQPAPGFGGPWGDQR